MVSRIRDLFEVRPRRRFVFRVFVIFGIWSCPWAAAVRAQTMPAERVYSGIVGEKYRIQMRLRREGKTLSGTYFYERLQKNLKLSGEIDAQNKFKLREYSESGIQTGRRSRRMKIAHRFIGGIMNVLTGQSVKRTAEKHHFVSFSRPLRGLRAHSVHPIPALKRWATFTQSATRTQAIDFCGHPATSRKENS